MDADTTKLIAGLRQAGLSKAAIDAAWPAWWSDEVAASPSSRTELRFALARKLGLAPKALLGERVEFVWKDSARFKHLKVENESQQQILNSFGVAVGRLVLGASDPGVGISGMDWLTLRDAILTSHRFVDLQNLIATCWSVGVPVIQLKVFPLDAKLMHAMVVEAGGRQAILIGRNARYPAPVAFTLAHEMGHIAKRHLEGIAALVDVEDPALVHDNDAQELEADAFSLGMLTGSESPEIETDLQGFNAPTLADAVVRAGPQYGVEPGTLALCLAYRRNIWPVAMASLKLIYGEPHDVGEWINAIAARNLDWSRMSGDGADYLRNLMQLGDA